MSISSEITSIGENLKKDYQSIANLGADLTNVDKNIENIAELLDGVYDRLPKTEFEEGESVTLENCLKGKLDFDDGKVGFGQASQDSTQGYQLFDITKKTSSTGTVINNGFKLVKSNNRVIRFMLNAIYPAGTYTLSMKQVSHISSITNYFYLNVQKKNGSDYDGVKNGIRINNSTDIEIQIPGEFDTLYFYIDNGETDNAEVTVDDIMLESGTTAHDWEEYTGGQASPNPSYPQTINSVTGNQDVVVSGKNLLPTGTKFTGGSNQWYDIDGNVMATLEQIQTSTNYIDLKPNTTYKFFAYEYNNIANMQVIYLDNTNTIKTYVNSVISTGISTFTTTDYTRVYVRVKASASANNTYFIGQLEEGTSSTPYEPYITPTSYQLSLGDIELNAIGDYKDELIYDVENDKVYKNIAIKKLVLDGSETINNTYTAFAIQIPNRVILGEGAYCNYYIYDSRSSGMASLENYTFAFQALTVFIQNKDFSSVDSFRNWLSTNKPIVYYPLYTAQKEEVTDTTLINQVKALYNAHSNNGTTIITSNGNLPMIIKVRGLKGE